MSYLKIITTAQKCVLRTNCPLLVGILVASLGCQTLTRPDPTPIWQTAHVLHLRMQTTCWEAKLAAIG
uniref:Uncharacterized protein n=1 Tax=Setaria italica TaxID=4555 RepID=K4AHP9_SETIT